MSRFSIIDGSWLLFRSYYWLPELNDEQGNNTNMIYGFAKMILKLIFEKPEYFALCRDVWWKTARHEMDETYKANRGPAPDDLIRQLQLSHQLASDLRIPSFWYPWYEADDVIATWVTKAKQMSWLYTTIVSSDKDLKQLISDQVDCWDPMKNKRINYQSFVKEYGFDPIFVADYLALIGDSSDNIPGVDGIGPKTALELIQQYHTIEEMYSLIDQWSQAHKAFSKLSSQRDIAEHSKMMVSLITVPEMNHLDIATTRLSLDFDVIRYILIDCYHFDSLEKLIADVEQKFQKPVMQGLFG